MKRISDSFNQANPVRSADDLFKPPAFVLSLGPEPLAGKYAGAEIVTRATMGAVA